MAKKTNFNVNGSSYFRTTATVGKNKNGNPIRKTFYGTSKKEADEKKEQYLHNINKGLENNYEKVVFIDVFKDWFLNILKSTVSANTFARYEVEYRLRISEFNFIYTPIIQVKATHIQKCYDSLYEKQGYNKVFSVNKIFKSFFIYALDEKIIIDNSMKSVRLPKNQEVVEIIEKAISEEDSRKIIEICKYNVQYTIFSFALLTGLRQGEILALRLKDVDLTNKVIHVTKTTNKVPIFDKDGNKSNYNQITKSPKTSSSIRYVPIVNNLIPMLENYIEFEKQKYSELNVEYNSDNLFFTSTTCTTIDARNLIKSWQRFLNRNKIEFIKFHALRHTFCTRLAENNIPIKTTSELLGHSNINTTAKIYTHVSQLQKQNAIEQLNSLF